MVVVFSSSLFVSQIKSANKTINHTKLVLQVQLYLASFLHIRQVVEPMQLRAYSDYSLRVLMFAALRSPDRVTVDEVAEAFSISRHYLVKIVHDLGCRGYLDTQRGVGGGFTLARPPQEIRLGDIIRWGEETETVIECTDKKNQQCRLFPACHLKGVLDEAAAAFFGVLDTYTLADLVRQPRKLRDELRI
ncbi:MAG TPA: Rrf2 family transcriptional regulator [Clostridia bacterium]|nr:Rrf2 family transcriptional regulator [Clostridia bacterium]